MDTFDYGDLLARLRKDLQLDLSTDVLDRTLIPDKVAPQSPGQVAIGTFNAANAVNTNFAAWTTFVNGTYLKAAGTGLVAMRAGIYLTRARVRWDNGATGLRALYVSVNAVGDAESEVIVPASAQSPGMITMAFAACNAGDVLSLAYFQNQGGVVATGAASVTAYWIGQRT